MSQPAVIDIDVPTEQAISFFIAEFEQKLVSSTWHVWHEFRCLSNHSAVIIVRKAILVTYSVHVLVFNSLYN